jgi:hypothetical protein
MDYFRITFLSRNLALGLGCKEIHLESSEINYVNQSFISPVVTNIAISNPTGKRMNQAEVSSFVCQLVSPSSLVIASILEKLSRVNSRSKFLEDPSFQVILQ